ncbi:MAG: SpoIIE family protein phosphatase, partial [Kofleriaceae bacterium]
LVNAIGVSADVGVEMAHVTLKRNDRLLLCSDGLHDYFPVEDEIAQRLSADKPGEALAEMVELAKTRGGHDNITGVAVHVVEVVEAIPTQFGEDSTQPVDVGNPFSADEPTQTAFTAGGITAPGATVTLTGKDDEPKGKTVPMRAIADDFAEAPTIPPPIKADGAQSKKKAEAKLADVDTDAETLSDDENAVKIDDAKPQSIATADTGPTPAPKR